MVSARPLSDLNEIPARAQLETNPLELFDCRELNKLTEYTEIRFAEESFRIFWYYASIQMPFGHSATWIRMTPVASLHAYRTLCLQGSQKWIFLYVPWTP